MYHILALLQLAGDSETLNSLHWVRLLSTDIVSDWLKNKDGAGKWELEAFILDKTLVKSSWYKPSLSVHSRSIAFELLSLTRQQFE